jgi:hypothetical protein
MSQLDHLFCLIDEQRHKKVGVISKKTLVTSMKGLQSWN